MGKRVTIDLVRFISAAFRALSWRACRFHPTCSCYAAEAFGRFSWLRALTLSVARILRCHPFSAGGFDPVPGREL